MLRKGHYWQPQRRETGKERWPGSTPSLDVFDARRRIDFQLAFSLAEKELDGGEVPFIDAGVFSELVAGPVSQSWN